jgi:hypothetical protein
MKISFIDTNKYYSKENETEKIHHSTSPNFLDFSKKGNLIKNGQKMEVKTSVEIQKNEDLKKENNVVSENKNLNSYTLSDDKTITELKSLKSWYNSIYDIVFSVLILVMSSGFFYIFRQSVNGEFNGIWTWLFPILVFSAFVIFLLIYSITVHTKNFLWTTLFLAFLISSIFAFYFWHILAIILMTFWTILSAHQMRKALVDSVKIHPTNLIKLGIGGIIFSVIVIMCSQYYWMMQSRSSLEILPRFSEVKVSEKVLGIFNIKSVTLDDLILMFVLNEEKVNNSTENNEEKKVEESGKINSFLNKIGINEEFVGQKIDDIKTTTSEKANEVLVGTMRKNLSKSVGQDLNGNESVGGIFDKIMYEKTANYFAEKQKNKSGGEISYLALILAGLLFLSFLTLETFLTPILVYLTFGLFWILLKLKIIKIIKVNRETEMIILQSAV